MSRPRLKPTWTLWTVCRSFVRALKLASSAGSLKSLIAASLKIAEVQFASWISFLRPKHVSFMEETDVLLLPCADRINIPGKCFEYLITGKPILALCYPDSEVARV